MNDFDSKNPDPSVESAGESPHSHLDKRNKSTNGQDPLGTILIVDDSEDARMLLELRLGREGYVPIAVDSVQAALLVLENRNIDAILLDIYMPDEDGFALLELIQSRKEFQDIPVLMISGRSDPDDLVRCIEMGAADYLAKPFNQTVLRTRLSASIAQKQHQQAPLGNNNPTPRLLVIDDNEMTRDILSRQFKRSGFEVDTAELGHVALEMIERKRYDILLLDMIMPDIDGMEVLQTIRSKWSLDQLPVFMVTSHDNSEAMVQAFQLGANDYVIKPINFPVVRARIEAHLVRRAAMLGSKMQQAPQDGPMPTVTAAPHGREASKSKETQHSMNTAPPINSPDPTPLSEAETQATADENSIPRPVRDDNRELAIGDRIGNYLILGVLGKGAMGVVYEAHHILLDQNVALKILPQRTQSRAKDVTRFQNEARAAAKVEHPNVVPILDVGNWSNTYHIAMQLVRGTTLDAVIKSEGAMPWREATRIMADTLRGLAAAHDRNLIHRDIKPANILLDGNGKAMISDFGISKLYQPSSSQKQLTVTGAIIGTPLYMSPEQAQGNDVDLRTDIYSVGATYYACLTGQPPYPGSLMAVLYAHCTAPVPNPRDVVADIPEACIPIIERAMAKQANDRYATADEMLADLQTLLASSDSS